MSDNKILNAEEFSQLILGNFISAKFKPHVEYIPEGDCIQALIKRTPSYYGKLACGHLVLYFTNDTNEFVGFMIENVSALIRKGKMSIDDRTIDDTTR